MLSRERRSFFLAWMRNPMRVGNPFISSKALSDAMAAQLEVKADEYVLEIGAGTGVVTKSILAAGIAPEKLIVIERDKKLHAQLTKRFPKLNIVLGDARDVKAILKANNIGKVAAVVSSLPLLAMKKPLRHEIVEASFGVLKPNGQYIQYCYGLFSPVPKRNQRQIGIKGKVKKRIWLNVPPALVWCYESEGA